MLSRWLVSATPSSGLCTRCPTPHIRGPRHSSPHGATTMEARWRMTSNRRKIRNKCERCNVWAHFVRGTRWCHWFSPARPGNTRTRCDESVTSCCQKKILECLDAHTEAHHGVPRCAHLWRAAMRTSRFISRCAPMRAPRFRCVALS